MRRHDPPPLHPLLLLLLLGITLRTALPVAANELTFERTVMVDSLTSLAGVTARDLDRDGIPDLVIAWDGLMKKMGTDGEGGLYADVINSALGRPSAMCLVDFGDGHVDIIVASYEGITMSALWRVTSADNARFNNPELLIPFAAGAQAPPAVVAGDVNGDGTPDVVLVGGAPGVAFQWLEVPRVPRENGTAAPPTPHVVPLPAGGSKLNTLALADIDGDGALDVVVGVYVGGIQWYRNEDARGSFGAPRTITTVVAAAWDFTIADFTGDGRLDIVCAPYGGPREALLVATDANGTFVLRDAMDPDPTIDDWVVSGWPALVAVDLDGDGDLDVVTTRGGAALAWIENTDGRGELTLRQPLSTVPGLQGVSLVDIDNDGDYDVVCASPSTGSVLLLRNLDPTYLFARPSPPPLHAFSSGILDIVAAEMMRDGHLDLVAVTASEPAAVWLLARTDVPWQSHNRSAVTAASLFAPFHLLDLDTSEAAQVAAADLDGDDRLDLVVSSFARASGNGTGGALVPTMYVLLNRSPAGGTAATAAAAAAAASSPTARATHSTLPVPLFELVASFPISGDLQQLFRQAIPVLLLDVARHGRSDLFTLTPDRLSVLRFRNHLNPNGTMVPPRDIFGRGSSFGGSLSRNVIVDMVAADINADGHPDIVIAVSGVNEVLWCPYDPIEDDFAFECKPFCTVVSIGTLDAGDLDGDGDVDIVVLSTNPGTVGWCENFVPGDANKASSRVVFGANLNRPQRVTVGDLDGDHDLDVAVLQLDGSVKWFENRGIDLRPLVMLPRASAGVNSATRDHARHRGATVGDEQLLTSLVLADVTEDGIVDLLHTMEDDERLFIEVNQLSPPPLVLRVLGELRSTAIGAHAGAAPRGDDAACLADVRQPCRSLGGAVAAANRWRRGATKLRLESPSDNEEAFIPVDGPANIDIWRTWREMLVIEVVGGTRGFGVTLVSNSTVHEGAYLLGVARAALLYHAAQVTPRLVTIRGAPLTLLGVRAVSDTEHAGSTLVYLSAVVLHLSGQPSYACGTLGQWSCACAGPALRARARQQTRTAPVRFRGATGAAIFVERSTQLHLDHLDFSDFEWITGAELSALVSVQSDSVLTANAIRFANNRLQATGIALQLLEATATIAAASFVRNEGRTALYLESSSLTFLDDVDFVDNRALTSAGGALVINDAKSTVQFFQDAVFRDNTAFTSGGAVYIAAGRMEVVGTLTLDRNAANGVGGGVHVDLGELRANAVVATDNTARVAGGAIRCEGFARAQLGAVVLQASNRQAKSLFRNNSAGGQGGAIASTSCAMLALGAATFESNRAGVALPPSGVALHDVTAGGGALFSDGDATILLSDTVWLRNTAMGGTYGGAIWAALADAADSAREDEIPDTLRADGNRAVGGGGGGFAFSYVSSTGAYLRFRNISGPVVRGAAAYGPLLATQFVATRLAASTALDINQTSRVPFVGRLEVEVLDAYEQIVAARSSTVLLVSPSAADASPIGPIALAADNGYVNWTDSQLALDGRPGTRVELLLSVVGETLDSPGSAARRLYVSVPLRPCHAGEQLASDERACIPCAAGSFSAETNARTCTPCPLGTHAPAVGASACAACGTREFTSHIGSVDCLTCGSFHYARVRTNSTVGCEPCPAHVDCVQYDEVLALPGYWLNRDSDGFVTVVPCGASRCIGGGLCARGRLPPAHNVLCGACSEGYVEWNGECVSCANSSPARIAGVLVAILIGSLALVYGYHLLTARASSSSRLKVLVFFVQAALVVLGSASASSRIALSLISLDPLRLVGASCVLHLSQFQRLMIGFSAPVLGIAVLAVVMLLVRWRGGALSPFGASAVAMLVLTFIPMVHTAFEFFRCVDVPVGDHVRRVVFAYPEVSCDSTAWRTSAVFVGFVLVLWLAVLPVVASRALRVYRRQRWQRSGGGVDIVNAEADGARSADSPGTWETAFEYAESFLSGGYRDAMYFYEFVVLGRRAALLAVNVVLATAEDQNIRLAASALFLMASAALHSVLQPFRRDEENRAEACSLAVLCVLPIAIISAHMPLQGGTGIAVLVTLVVLPALLLLVWVVRGFFQQREAGKLASASTRVLELHTSGASSCGLRDPLLVAGDEEEM